MRVMLVDDNQPLRTMLRHTLESSGAEVCAEAGDADTALREAHSQRPDVVLLDINMPGGGLNALARLTSELPEIPVVMLTARDDDHALLTSLRGGAVGYVVKGTDPWELPFLLEDAVNGKPALSSRAIQQLIGYVRGGPGMESRAGFQVRLSDREWEVLSRLREGRSTREIAEELSVEPVTVRRHISSILHKLNVSTREEALALLEGAVEGGRSTP
jgi:two-component system nitrate/nitrite response regulator NarL